MTSASSPSLRLGACSLWPPWGSDLEAAVGRWCSPCSGPFVGSGIPKAGPHGHLSLSVPPSPRQPAAGCRQGPCIASPSPAWGGSWGGRVATVTAEPTPWKTSIRLGLGCQPEREAQQPGHTQPRTRRPGASLPGSPWAHLLPSSDPHHPCRPFPSAPRPAPESRWGLRADPGCPGTLLPVPDAGQKGAS